MQEPGSTGDIRENTINMQLPVSSFWYIFISQIGGIGCVSHPGLTWIPSWLVPRVGNLFCWVPLLGFSPFSPGELLLLTLLDVNYQYSQKGFPWAPAGSVPFCLASFLPITWLLFPLILLQRGSHLFCWPAQCRLNEWEISEYVQCANTLVEKQDSTEYIVKILLALINDSWIRQHPI